jgi:aryl-alcohol dehydrogenase-like predicted oxidoreductase
MKRTSVGSLGLAISRVGLGCATFGREIDEQQSFRILDRAFELGINLLDTAESYGGGQARAYRQSLGIDDVREASQEMHSSEKIIGRWLKTTGLRKEIVLETKVQTNFTPTHIAEALQASLERLQTDRVEIYLFHSYDSSTPLREAMEGMTAAVRSGRVLVAGCSNFSLEQLRDSVRLAKTFGLAPLEVAQPPYSLVRREIEPAILPFCGRNGIAPIVYSPLGAGFLTGKYKPGKAFPKGTRFDIVPGHADEYFSERNFQVVEGLSVIAERWRMSIAELAIAWVLRNPEVKGVLIGARTLEHVQTACRAAELDLPDKLYDELNEL